MDEDNDDLIDKVSGPVLGAEQGNKPGRPPCAQGDNSRVVPYDTVYAETLGGAPAKLVSTIEP